MLELVIGSSLLGYAILEGVDATVGKNSSRCVERDGTELPVIGEAGERHEEVRGSYTIRVQVKILHRPQRPELAKGSARVASPLAWIKRRPSTTSTY